MASPHERALAEDHRRTTVGLVQRPSWSDYLYAGGAMLVLFAIAVGMFGVLLLVSL